MRPARQTFQNQGAAMQTMTLTLNPTQTLVTINQKQSLRLIQITVSAALSTILYIKNLFPDDYFETRTYDIANPNFPYTVKPSSDTIKQQENDKANVTWDILRRGKHAHTDKMWSWLDGVCDALKQKYLATFQISFHNGAVSLDTIAEVYVMKFSYSTLSGETQFDIISGNQTVEVTARDMQDLNHVFSKLVKMASRRTDKFPEHPTISMQLTYNDTCPVNYEPRGFAVALDSSIIVNQDGFNIGEMGTRYHNVGMSLVIPHQTAHSDINGSTLGVEMRSNSHITFSKHHLTSRPANSSPYDGSTILNTQDSIERRQISSMIPTRRGIEDTQRIETQSETPFADGSSQDSISSSPVEKIISPPNKRIFHFPDDVVRDLYPTREWRNNLNEPVPTSNTEVHNANCHCEKKFDGMTMQCEVCQDRQHLRCYGYLDTDVLLDKHICYKCLLVNEPSLRQDMKDVALLRQMVWVVSVEGYPLKESDLAKRIGCFVKDVITMSLKLTDEKYLRKVSRPRNKKNKNYCKRLEMAPFEFMIGERERLFKEYLSPTFKIEQYLREGYPIQGEKEEISQKMLPAASISYPLKTTVEAVSFAPTTSSHLPETPNPTRSNLISTGTIYDIFDNDIDATTPHPGDVSSTQGTPSHAGSPGLRGGKKRAGVALEGSARRLKRPSWVNSPFSLRKGTYL